MAAEIYKACAHAGRAPALAHYREVRGAEVDVIVEEASTLFLVEAKSGATVARVRGLLAGGAEHAAGDFGGVHSRPAVVEVLGVGRRGG